MNSSHNSIPTTTRRTIARTVGVLLLAVFVLYGVGNAIATRAADDSRMLTLGVAMMVANSVAVLAIGALLVPVLRPHSPLVARVYLATRIFEATLLSTGAIALLAGSPGVNLIAYNVAMAGLGIGSLFFCALLYRTALVPRFLAMWGFAGYAALAAGSLIALAGVTGAGLIGAIPGGLFEIFLAFWLIARGFASRPAPAGTVGAWESARP
jgi:Domain of unknown function (DUF4386)